MGAVRRQRLHVAVQLRRLTLLTSASNSLQRDRAIVFGVLGLLVAIAWAYLFRFAAAMDDMGSTLAMPMTAAWTLRDWAVMTTMWIVMMIGMMLPSVSPMIVAYRGFNAGRRSTPAFLLGYSIVWSAFAVVAAAVQWLLHGLRLVTPVGVTSSPRLAGGLLIAAGIYQFTPLKRACLRSCRTPLAFLMTEWREGRRGGVLMGLRHGAFCVGCCWALMALLFVLGVMNLAWIAVLALIVLIEKVAPSARLFSVTSATALMIWGAALIL